MVPGGSNIGPTWRQLGPILAQHRPNLAPVLAQHKPHLGPTWRHLGGLESWGLEPGGLEPLGPPISDLDPYMPVLKKCSNIVQELFKNHYVFFQKVFKKLLVGMTASLTSQNESTLRIKILNESTLK